MQVDGHDVEHKQQRDGSVKSAVDKYQLLPEFLKVRGLVKQHLDSFNYFVNTDIKKIVGVNDRLVSAVDPRIYVRFTDVRIVRIDQPSVIGDVIKKKSTTPQMCRLSGMMYFAPILVNIEYTTLVKDINTGLEKIVTSKREFVIREIPIMLRSRCCVLYGKNEAELARVGECPLDPGGYFIIKGTEKVLLIQEHLSKNQIIVDTDKKSKINVSVTSNTELVKSKTVIQMEKGKVYLILNQFVKKIPIMVVLKAMGMESDQEVVQMLGSDPRFSALLLPSIEECASLDIYTQEKASEYLEGKVKTFTFGSPSSNQEGRALVILRDVFLANVPVSKKNFRPKCLYVGVMLRRMMEAMLNNDANHAMDDKDYVGNKRLELSGQLISLLFEDLFKMMITESQKEIDKHLKKHRACRFDPTLYINKKLSLKG